MENDIIPSTPNGRRPVRAWLLVALAGALSFSAVACGDGGGAGAADATDAAKGSLVGAAAPDFVAQAVTGDGPKTLAEAKGKVVILDFWGTYCEPCKKSFPKYQGLADKYGADLAILAVSVDDTDSAKKEDLIKFAKDNGAKFSIVWDTDHSAAKKYNPATMPSSFIIDKGGVVRHVHVGYTAGEEDKIDAEVKALLGK